MEIIFNRCQSVLNLLQFYANAFYSGNFISSTESLSMSVLSQFVGLKVEGIRIKKWKKVRKESRIKLSYNRVISFHRYYSLSLVTSKVPNIILYPPPHHCKPMMVRGWIEVEGTASPAGCDKCG